MEQGDTLFIYGDYLYYDGMTQIAQLRENVKMINRNTTLLTDSLNYDRLYDLGYYFEGGTLMDEENVLTLTGANIALQQNSRYSTMM